MAEEERDKNIKEKKENKMHNDSSKNKVVQKLKEAFQKRLSKYVENKDNVLVVKNKSNCKMLSVTDIKGSFAFNKMNIYIPKKLKTESEFFTWRFDDFPVANDIALIEIGKNRKTPLVKSVLFFISVNDILVFPNEYRTFYVHDLQDQISVLRAKILGFEEIIIVLKKDPNQKKVCEFKEIYEIGIRCKFRYTGPLQAPDKNQKMSIEVRGIDFVKVQNLYSDIIPDIDEPELFLGQKTKHLNEMKYMDELISSFPVFGNSKDFFAFLAEEEFKYFASYDLLPKLTENFFKDDPFARNAKITKCLREIIDILNETKKSNKPNKILGAFSLLGMKPSTGEISLDNLSEILKNPDYSLYDFLDKFIEFVIQPKKNVDVYTAQILYNIFCSGSLLQKLEILKIFINGKARSDILEEEIDIALRKTLDDQQTEYILREKMKIIRQKLEDNYEKREEDPVLQKQGMVGKNLRYPENILKLLKQEKEKLRNLNPNSPEVNVAENYIDLVENLPWRKVKVENLDLKKLEENLNTDHYGIEKVKQRILEFISVKVFKDLKNVKKTHIRKVNYQDQNGLKREFFIDKSLFSATEEDLVSEENATTSSPEKKTFNNTPILTLVGPPGVGKTSLAKSIAKALDLPFVKVSLGGLRDESEIRGHRKTYVGAMPGKIIKAIRKAKFSNAVILLDEIDKLGNDHRGDPASAMLEVLDPEQNANFLDNYLDTEYDLSRIFFISTANYYEQIPAPLLDRVEIIELSSYTETEKLEIAKKHLIPKVLTFNNLESQFFQISDSLILQIIQEYTREAGVRELQRLLDKIVRKIIILILKNSDLQSFKLTKNHITEFLGAPIYLESEIATETKPGLVNGLAYTSYGGDVLAVEVTTYPVKNGGSSQVTGQLRDVMRESSQIALVYIRANAKKFGVEKFDFEKNSIHIHVPEGAVPKDGPSAGITFTTALISKLKNKPVSSKNAMTGEITLRGQVLPIGGLKEKSIAAIKKGIDTIFVPKQNKKDIYELPKEVKEKINFILVDDYQTVYDYIFADKKTEVNSKYKFGIDSDKKNNQKAI